MLRREFIKTMTAAGASLFLPEYSWGQNAAPRRPMYPAAGVALNSISGLQLWLKADALALSNNDPIGSWADSSTNGRDASASGGNRPTFTTGVMNGKPAARCNGSSSKMTISGNATFLISATFTAFFVVKITSNKANNHLVGGTDGNTNAELRLGYSSTSQLFFGQYINDLSGSATTNSSGEILTFASRTTGKQILQSNVSRASNSNTDLLVGTSGFTLFFSGLTGEYFAGDVPEIAIYSPALNSTDEQAVYDSLKLKYGL